MPNELQKLAAIEGYDFSLPVPEGVGDSPTRRAQTITTWYCRTKNTNQDVGVARIDWGHKKADAEGACNAWRPKCNQNGGCTAFQVTESMWNCYRASDLKFINNVQIDRGHNVGHGIWACNNRVSACGNSNGGCIVTGGIVWSDGSSSCNAKTTSDGCSGGFDWERRALKRACDQHDYCYHGPIVASFQETYHWCSNLFIREARALDSYATYAAEIWYAAMRADPLWDSGVVVEGGFGKGFQNEQIVAEKRCLLGRSLPRGYTTTP